MEKYVFSAGKESIASYQIAELIYALNFIALIIAIIILFLFIPNHLIVYWASKFYQGLQCSRNLVDSFLKLSIPIHLTDHMKKV